MKTKLLALVCLLCALPTFGQVYMNGGVIMQQDLNAASPSFNPTAPYSGAATTVTISCTTPSPTIYYTTDGSTPTHASSSGTSVAIASTSTLKAICAASNYDDSAVTSGTYTISGGGLNYGYTSVGATNAGSFNSYVFGTQFTAGANAAGYSVTSCSAYFTTKDGTSPIFQCAIYTDSSNAPNTKVCASTDITIVTVPGWTASTSQLTGCGTLAANTKYWVFLTVNGNGTNINYDGATGSKYKGSVSYGSWPTPLGAVGGDWGSVSLYITVTAN